MASLRSPASSVANGGLLLLLLVSWEAGARLVPSAAHTWEANAFPPPSAAFFEAANLLWQGVLYQHAIASLQRVYCGVALAAGLAIPLGFAMAMSRTADEQVSPVVNLIRPIPPVAWVPITILWFGVSDLAQYLIIFVGTFAPLLLNTSAGVRGVDEELKRAALTLGAGRFTLLGVVFRAALPEIMVGLRGALATGWFIIVASEMVAAASGLGFLITESRTAMTTERLYVAMVAIAVIGLIQERVLLALERKLVPWRSASSI
jgi:ABC-type nitrate/sulfonate/bicarbonate transport system permease component